jgi:hypothetical protein
MAVYSDKKERELQTQIASVALAIEAIERKLIRLGFLKEDELMQAIGELAKEKTPEMVTK